MSARENVGGDPEGHVLALEERRYRALLKADVPTLESLLSAQLWYSHTSGARDTKESYLAKIREGLITYRDIRPEVLAVETWSGGAMVLARVRVEGVVARAPVVLDSAILTVWRPEAGRWRLVAHHPTDLG